MEYSSVPKILYIKIHHIYTNLGRNAYILTISTFTARQLYTQVTNLVLYCITLFDSIMKFSCGPKHVGIFIVML